MATAAAAAAPVSSWVSALAPLPARLRLEVQRTVNADVEVQKSLPRHPPPPSMVLAALTGTPPPPPPLAVRVRALAAGRGDAAAPAAGTAAAVLAPPTLPLPSQPSSALAQRLMLPLLHTAMRDAAPSTTAVVSGGGGGGGGGVAPVAVVDGEAEAEVARRAAAIGLDTALASLLVTYLRRRVDNLGAAAEAERAHFPDRYAATSRVLYGDGGAAVAAAFRDTQASLRAAAAAATPVAPAAPAPTPAAAAAPPAAAAAASALDDDALLAAALDDLLGAP